MIWSNRGYLGIQWSNVGYFWVLLMGTTGCLGVGVLDGGVILGDGGTMGNGVTIYRVLQCTVRYCRVLVPDLRPFTPYYSPVPLCSPSNHKFSQAPSVTTLYPPQYTPVDLIPKINRLFLRKILHNQKVCFLFKAQDKAKNGTLYLLFVFVLIIFIFHLICLKSTFPSL